MGNRNSLYIGAGLIAAIGGIAVCKYLCSSGTCCRFKWKSKKVALVDPEVKYSFELVLKEELTHDTRRFRFALPSPQHSLGVSVGQHIYLSAKINDELVVRTYSPTTSDDDKGYFEIVFKVYKAGIHPKFPNGGKMTQYLDSLNVGDKVEVRGPSGRLRYKGKGVFEIRLDKKSPPIIKKVKRVGLIAGGTGITPMYGLIKEICKHPEDKTKLQLLFANHTENDILLREDLEQLRDNHRDKFDLWYTISTSVQEGWAYSIGLVDDELIHKHLPAPSNDVLILMCGPPLMIQFACLPNLDKLGFTKDQRFAY